MPTCAGCAPTRAGWPSWPFHRHYRIRVEHDSVDSVMLRSVDVIEAGCKTVIGSRLKKSGMFWAVRGSNAILALRCCHLNGRFESYWWARSAA